MQCSDISVQQRQAQQRQILAMMGIDQWVRPDSTTISIANIKTQIADLYSKEQSVLKADIENVDINNSSFVESSNITNITDNDVLENLSQTDPSSNAPVIIDNDYQNDNPLLLNNSETDVINGDNESKNTDDLNSHITLAKSVESMKVAPFDLQGGRYGNWILIVDIQALNNDSQKLWQNIVQALSIECETSSFPICVGMDTAELANASLAGYLFKIAQSEDIKVAVLTALPKGLMHPNFIDVPTLDSILEDSILKRQLWQQISV